LAPLSQRHSVVRFGTVVSIIANRQESNKKEDNTGGMACMAGEILLSLPGAKREKTNFVAKIR